MALSTSLGRLITSEWIDGNSFKRSQPTASGGDLVNLDFAEELYETILSVFAQVCRTYSKPILLWKQRQCKEALGRVHLWGRDFQDGRLARVLAQSDDLRNTVIELLGQIGKGVLDLANLDDCDKNFAELVRGLRNLISRARIIIAASDPSDSDADVDLVSALHFGTKRRDLARENRSPRRKSLSRGVEGKEDLQYSFEQLESDIEPETRSRPSTVRGDQSPMYTPETSEDEDESSDSGTLLECSIDCLMDLIPTMEQSLAHIQSRGIQTKTSSRVPFSVSELALPWVRNVSDKFTSADTALVERLGEANWQRYMTLRARTEQRIQSLDIRNVATDNIPMVQIFPTAPQSTFKPLSLFHDSGLGSSVPTLPRYTMSTASHTSFLSSVAGDSALALRVPPTPVEVALGNPFECDICGHLLSNIKNRVDWKIHVFADLQPYICTFDSCAKDFITFPTRSLWGSHEFDEHRVTRCWKCPECAHTGSTAQMMEEHLRKRHGESITLAQLPLIISAAETKSPLPIEDQRCPLCKCIPGKSQRNFVKHVGRHMESLALAVLPRDTAEASDRSSNGSIVPQDELPNEIFSMDLLEGIFFVPPDFHLHTNLKGRDQELQLLDEGLFSAKKEHGTAAVLLHGHTISCKLRLVQHYINLNRSKFPGGIFWINSKSNKEIDASLLVIARKYIWSTDKSEMHPDRIASNVTAWFASRSQWLIVLNDVKPSWLKPAEEVIERRWPTPNSRHSSLIYISGQNNSTSFSVPLDPIPLEIKPLRSTRPRASEQNEVTDISSADEGFSFRPDFVRQPSTTLEKSMIDHGYQNDGPGSSDEKQVHNPTIGKHINNGMPILKYALAPEDHDAPRSTNTVHSSITEYSHEQHEPSPDHESLAPGLFSAEPKLTHTPYDHTPRLLGKLPNHLSNQSTLTGLGISDKNKLLDVSRSEGPKILSFHVPECSVSLGNLLDHIEHCEESHGKIPNNISKHLNDRNGETVTLQGPLLLEQPVMITPEVPQPKLVRQNLGVDLFHKIQAPTSGDISPSVTKPLRQDYLSSELVNGNSIPATDIENQQNQAEAPQKKHKCPYCSTMFTRHHNLKSHLLTHSQDKPWVCDKCGTRFRRLHDLKRHRKLHRDERAYACSVCNRTFARLDALERHLKTSGSCTSQGVAPNSRENNDENVQENWIDKITTLEANEFKDVITAALNPKNATEKDMIRCVCGQKEYPGLPKSARDAFESGTYHNRTRTSVLTVDPAHLGSLFIQCDVCKVWQHGNCVGICNAAMCPDTYFCEQCAPADHTMKLDPSTGLIFSDYFPGPDSRHRRSIPSQPDDNSSIPHPPAEWSITPSRSQTRASQTYPPSHNEFLARATRTRRYSGTLWPRYSASDDEAMLSNKEAGDA
ncbi:hypothetical protein MMC26_005187 [Xylographa opegraphella]|nr:hypothetical protein [Xylographa opegraphella]